MFAGAKSNAPRAAWYFQPCWMALAALLFRLMYIIVRHTYRFAPTGDHYAFGLETGSIARSIAAGEGFASPFRGSTGPSAWIGPTYPYLCAGVFKLFGIFSDASAFVILTFNSIFAALTCWPMLAVGRRTVGRLPAAIAVWMWAVTPVMMKWAAEWVWEVSLSALLVALCYQLTLELAEESTSRRWLCFGLLWGVALLTNPALLTLLPFSLCWLAYRRGVDRALLRNAAFSMLVCLLLISPWLVRNRVVFGRWVFLRSNFGFELHLGNYHGSFGMGWGGLHPSVNMREWQLYQQMGELAYVAQKQREALQFIRQNPREFAGLCLTRVISFWDGSSLGYAYDPPPWTQSRFLWFSVFGLAGLIWALRERLDGAGLFLWIVLYPAPYYITYPQPRYRHAVEPLMLLLGSWLVVEIARAAGRVTSTKRVKVAAAS